MSLQLPSGPSKTKPTCQFQVSADLKEMKCLVYCDLQTVQNVINDIHERVDPNDHDHDYYVPLTIERINLLHNEMKLWHAFALNSWNLLKISSNLSVFCLMYYFLCVLNFLFIHIYVILICHFSLYSTKMAKKYKDSDHFPAFYQFSEFNLEFKMLKDKKENSLRAISACETLLDDTSNILLNLKNKQQRMSICEMLLKTSEKLCKFLLRNLKFTTAIKVDLNIIMNLTNNNLTEMSLLICHYVKLIEKNIFSLECLKHHDSLFNTMLLINVNLQSLNVQSK